MSTYTKRYFDKKDENKHLTLVWEPGYKNLEVYYFKKLLYTVENPIEIKKGHRFVSEDVGAIDLAFTSTKPMKLVVKVEGRKYKTNINKGEEKVSYPQISALFYVMAFFRLLALAGLTYALYDLITKGNPLTSFILFYLYNLVFFLVYLLTAIRVKKQPKLFFIGSSFFFFIVAVSLLSFVGFNLFSVNVTLPLDFLELCLA